MSLHTDPMSYLRDFATSELAPLDLLKITYHKLMLITEFNVSQSDQVKAAASTQVGYHGIIIKFRQLPAEVWTHSVSYKSSVSTQYWPIPKGLVSELVLEREKTVSGKQLLTDYFYYNHIISG